MRRQVIIQMAGVTPVYNTTLQYKSKVLEYVLLNKYKQHNITTLQNKPKVLEYVLLNKYTQHNITCLQYLSSLNKYNNQNISGLNLVNDTIMRICNKLKLELLNSLMSEKAFFLSR